MPLELSDLREDVSELVEQVREDNGGKLDRLTWTLVHRPYIKPDVKFELEPHPWLRGIYEEENPRQVVKKAGQTFISELAVNHLFHQCDEVGHNGVVLFPTDGDVSAFSSSRVGPAIESSSYLQKIVGAKKNDRRPDLAGANLVNQVKLKRIGNRWAYFVGGGVDSEGQASQLKSKSADFVIFDEVDEIDYRAIVIARKRMNASMYKGELMISTPTYEGHGIDRFFEPSTQNFWFIPCPHCGLKQHLTPDNLILEWDDIGRPIKWHTDTYDEPFLACSKCAKPLNRLAPGEWVSKYPTRRVAGYHVTKLFTLTADLVRTLEELQSFDATERKEAMNQDLGLAIVPPADARLNEDVLDECVRSYNPAEPKLRGRKVTMGIDVGDMLNVTVRGGPVDGVRHLLGLHVCKWASLDALVTKYNPDTIVIDAQPETSKARDFQEKYKALRVWLCYVTDTVTHRSGLEWNRKKGTVRMARTQILDKTFARFRDESNVHSLKHRDAPLFYDHMTALIREVKKNKKGIPIAVFTHSRPDHYAFSEAFTTVGTELYKSA